MCATVLSSALFIGVTSLPFVLSPLVMRTAFTLEEGSRYPSTRQMASTPGKNDAHRHYSEDVAFRGALVILASVSTQPIYQRKRRLSLSHLPEMRIITQCPD